MSLRNERNRYLREGEHTKDYIPVMGSVTNIPQRLKEVDPRFFVMLNVRNQTYEIHIRGQEGGTYGCTLPYGTLDARAIEYVKKYSAARTAQTIAEIERCNEKLERDQLSQKLDTAGQKMKEAYRYLDNHESAETLPKELIDG